ncbi:MAG: RNA polymerase sigma factor [Pirellulales bacterium]|nr:RNA polymerase sigma factor [Pirellulales bacterium]
MPDPSLSNEIAGLVRTHHEELYRYAFRLAGNQPDAEDLVQQTFLVAQQKLGQVRDASCTRSWLFTVLRNHFLKNLRKQQRVVAGSEEIEFDSLPDTVPDQLDIDAEALQLALDELPADYRAVVVMFYFEDCSYKEIASQLEIAIGTVMSRLWRAKRHLRARLAPLETADAGDKPENDDKPENNVPQKRPIPQEHTA